MIETRNMAIASAILIVVYIVTLVAVIKWPTRQHHPEDPMAVGCLSMVVAALVLLGILLALAASFHVRWAVTAIFAISVFPAIVAGPQLAWMGVKKLRQRAAEKGVRIPAEQLAERLRGMTHVIRTGSVDPPRQWSEMRFFAPDGRVVEYREEGGRIERVEGNITWTVEKGLLVTLNDIKPGNRNSYVLKETPDKQIAYYIHAPLSRINGLLSRKTAAIVAGEPVVTPPLQDG